MKPNRTLSNLVTITMLVALLLTSTTATAIAELPSKEDLDQKARQSIAIYASSEEFLNIPYVYCGSSTNGFDCSGFVQYIYAHFGYTLERTTKYQKNMGAEIIGMENLLPGDLVFFRNFHHVGIYLGNNEFVHASSGSGKVVISSLAEGYYYDHYSGARRIF